MQEESVMDPSRELMPCAKSRCHVRSPLDALTEIWTGRAGDR